jgi:hypothetical protein
MNTSFLLGGIQVNFKPFPCHRFPIIDEPAESIETGRIHGIDLFQRFTFHLYVERFIILFTEGKKDEEKDGRGKNIHPYRVEVTGSAADHVFLAYKTRLEDQIFHGAEKLSVEMCYIFKEM